VPPLLTLLRAQGVGDKYLFSAPTKSAQRQWLAAITFAWMSTIWDRDDMCVTAAGTVWDPVSKKPQSILISLADPR